LIDPATGGAIFINSSNPSYCGGEIRFIPAGSFPCMWTLDQIEDFLNSVSRFLSRDLILQEMLKAASNIDRGNE
jgi:hypothetical protein